MNNEKIRVRFAPSPTGYLHVGGARTALFNYLYAKKHKGIFVLRIEDTDQKREAEGSYGMILSDLEWLGINWDEGPIRQTDRLEIYRQKARELLSRGMAYHCYCTPEELEERRSAGFSDGTAGGYDGRCRDLRDVQKAEYEKQGRLPCLRFNVPGKPVTVDDLVRGQVRYEAGFCSDFVIMKSDGTPSYNFAVVVDDADMGITHVIRGEEHLVNTPRQILLYEAMEYPLPEFAHTSMILAPDRSKMSKRHGTVAVGEYRQQGVLAEALLNYIALLGWSPGDDEEFFTMSRLEEEFDLDRVSKSPSVYDQQKLYWMNSKYIQDMTPADLLARLMPFWEGADYMTPEIQKDREYLAKVTSAVKTRLTLLPDIIEEARIFFDGEIPLEDDAREALQWPTTPAVFEAFLQVIKETGGLREENFMDAIREIQKRSGAKGKKLYMALRVGITGQIHGVEMKDLLVILPPDLMKKRLETMMEAVGA